MFENQGNRREHGVRSSVLEGLNKKGHKDSRPRHNNRYDTGLVKSIRIPGDVELESVIQQYLSEKVPIRVTFVPGAVHFKIYADSPIILITNIHVSAII